MTMFELVETLKISYHKRSYGFGAIVGVPASIIQEVIMVPVIGMDVSKENSVIQAFLRRNEPYGKAKQIYHNEQGFE
ncbi:hypothetical protein AZ66_23445 [Paenibacillus sp. E194]|nr:hypothetical protein AZ66_23445 [Paenibacillus sp. E194]